MSYTSNVNLVVYSENDLKAKKAGEVFQDLLDSTSSNMTKIDTALAKLSNLIFTNQTPVFTSDNTYNDYSYKGTIALAGVTANDFAEVVFGVTQAMSGDYAPICETYDGGVYIYAKSNSAIVIPTIKVERSL